MTTAVRADDNASTGEGARHDGEAPLTTNETAVTAMKPQMVVGDSDHGLHRIVIVGGGAGGLELATRLGNQLGKSKRAHVTLIEKKRNHFWKPHLHEIAAGSMDIGVFQTNYLAQAHWHHFRYRIGEVIGLDRVQRYGTVAPFTTGHGGDPTAPAPLRHAGCRRRQPDKRLGRRGQAAVHWKCRGDAGAPLAPGQSHAHTRGPRSGSSTSSYRRGRRRRVGGGTPSRDAHAGLRIRPHRRGKDIS